MDEPKQVADIRRVKHLAHDVEAISILLKHIDSLRQQFAAHAAALVELREWVAQERHELRFLRYDRYSLGKLAMCDAILARIDAMIEGKK